jgi:hypothetical protein
MVSWKLSAGSYRFSCSDKNFMKVKNYIGDTISYAYE